VRTNAALCAKIIKDTKITLAVGSAMTIRGKAYIAGAYERPLRKAPDKTTAQLHAECAKGALEDAGLSLRDVDGTSAPAMRRASVRST
jgi:3-oxoacyl-[acyl-carrier-protein] synthase III